MLIPRAPPRRLADPARRCRILSGDQALVRLEVPHRNVVRATLDERGGEQERPVHRFRHAGQRPAARWELANEVELTPPVVVRVQGDALGTIGACWRRLCADL
jgi:hypothetical protein